MLALEDRKDVMAAFQYLEGLPRGDNRALNSGVWWEDRSQWSQTDTGGSDWREVNMFFSP